MKIEDFITELQNLKTFSFKKYDMEGKVCIDKIGVDIKDLQNIINQFKENKK